MLKPEKCWYITISGHDNISPIMMIYVKIQEKASKTRAFITRRVTNIFIFYFLHKSEVICLPFITHRVMVSKNKLRTQNRWYITDCRNIFTYFWITSKCQKRAKLRIREKTRVCYNTPCYKLFYFLLFAQILDWVYGSRCFWVCRIAARNGKKSCTKAQNPWYHWLSEG